MARPQGKQTGITLGYVDLRTGARVYPAPPPPSSPSPPATAQLPSDHPPPAAPASDLLPEQQPPPQGRTGNVTRPDHSSEQHGSMFANITTWPPLGQSTVIPADAKTVTFTVILDTAQPPFLQAEPVDVRIWHNYGEPNSWQETPLELDDSRRDTLVVATANGHYLRRWYTGHMPLGLVHTQSTSFTVKFKRPDEVSWKWIRDHSRIPDGILHFARPLKDHHLSDFFYSTDAAVHISTPKSDSPNSFLFSLTAPVKSASGEESGFSCIKLGSPRDVVRWFALVRLWAPWLAPRQSAGKFNVDNNAVLVSFLRQDGFHVVCLALSGIGDVTSLLVHDDHGNVIIKARNDSDRPGTARVLVAISDSFEVANSAAMYHARKLVMENPATTPEMESLFKECHVPPKPQWYEDWYDGFTYCTWNSLGQNLSEQKILDALDDLEKSGISIENLIIDDNWQSNTKGETQFERAWSTFEADPDTFPNGLKSAISKIRRRYPQLRHIAVWHAMMGYWGGISPSGEIAKDYKTQQVTYDMSVISGKRTVVSGSDITKMYDDFYRFLADCGITSVKTDVQFYLDQINEAPARQSLISAYQDAWTLAHLRHFSSRAISCMSQSPSILFHAQLPSNRPVIPVRNSDDFFPEIAASHPWHIFCNAHNSLLTQHLNVLPDWDMFSTLHDWGSFHAAARCVSGGPIYFTDTPGKHDMGVINAMSARTPDSQGRRVILRPHRTGRSISAYSAYTDPALVKVGTYVGFARTGSGIVGVFNCLENLMTELIRLSDIPGTEPGVDYVVRSFCGKVSRVMRPEDEKAVVCVELFKIGWAILAAHPVKEGIAVLGLTDKMTGIAAVLGYEVVRQDTGRLKVSAQLKAVGVYGVWVKDLTDKDLDRDVMVLVRGKVVDRAAVRVSKDCAEVLEVDLEILWEKEKDNGGLSAGNNEVGVEVFVS